MAITLSTSARLKFIPESEAKEEKPATLHMTPLTLREEETLLDQVREEEGGRAVASSDMNKTVREHLVGWENWLDEEGAALEFPEGGITDELLVTIPPAVRVEAFGFLLGQAGMRTEEDLGKSE